jgi:hypothetical protein
MVGGTLALFARGFRRNEARRCVFLAMAASKTLIPLARSQRTGIKAAIADSPMTKYMVGFLLFV